MEPNYSPTGSAPRKGMAEDAVAAAFKGTVGRRQGRPQLLSARDIPTLWPHFEQAPLASRGGCPP